MRFDRLDLRNFKCYEDATVSLDPGVTVIHGINGSGKSSLLEAGFFSLYGVTALDRTLDDIVTIGEEEAEIELHFTHDGREYRLRRRIRATGERPTTAECVLEGPEETLDGVTDVEDRIVSMLRMDANAFVNSAFVRQGEINKLIEATPGERQRMIDRLLQLGKLEDYRERANEARLGVENLLDRWEGRLETVEEQIEEKEDRDLHARKSTLESELAELSADIDRYEENRETAKETLSEAESTLEEYEERKSELETVEERVAELRESIAETESERESLSERITAHRDAISDLETRIDELASEAGVDEPTMDTVEETLEAIEEERSEYREAIIEFQQEVSKLDNDAQRLEERASDLEERATDLREEAADLESEASTAETAIEAAESDLESARAEIESLEAGFEDAPVDRGSVTDHLESLREDLETRRERETEIREQLATSRSRVEEAEALLDAGKCPECGQPVQGSPHVESLSEYRETVESHAEDLEAIQSEIDELEAKIEVADSLRQTAQELRSLEERRETLQSVLEERRETLEEKQTRTTQKRETATDLEEQANAAREHAETKRSEAAEYRTEIGSVNETLGELKERREILTDLRDAIEKRDEHREGIEDIQEKRENLASRNEERREHLEREMDRKRRLSEAVDEQSIEAARREKQRAEAYLEKVEAELAELREAQDDRQAQLGAITNELEALENLREKRDGIATKVDSLESVHAETEDLERMYGDLRAELRQQNVARLERLLNETFELVYQNDSYARIELSGQYELTVYQKDGEPLEPDQLSGGERALFNLSLRTAIYRLLVEGIEGAAPMPPLILDEPTVFLDSGHVSQLVTLVESMRELGVEQIIVVSHDEELVGAADDVIRVRKDPTTNRSYIEATDVPIEAD